MENGKRIYQIEINGLKESIDQVESLRKQLDMLSAQIDVLEKKTISIKVDMPSTQGVSAQGVSTNSSSSNSTRNTSSLNEEVALEKEINKLKNEGVALDAKIAAAQTEVYQKVQATKDLYKETIEDQKQLAAQERLTANAYSNTMQGMKQHLADLKTALNTTDLGDSDKIKQMTQEANELTNKLKQMEEAYGQFGRNVGNYKSAAEGFTKFRIQVGETVREFTSAREASRQLKQELLSLDESAEGAQELRKAIQQVDSAIKDLNKSSQAMDELLDTMEGFAAIGATTNGLAALFGFDDGEIQKSIQKLVALQNVLKGIETINKQINTQEGIGKWISAGNAAIDKFVVNLTSSKKGMDGLAASTVKTTKAMRALSFILKGFGVGLAIGAIMLFTGVLDKLVDKLKGTKEKIDNLEESQKMLSETFKTRMNVITSSYLNDQINAEEMLSEVYKNETNYLVKQIDFLKERASILKESVPLYQTWIDTLMAQGNNGNINFSGKKFTSPTTVGHGTAISLSGDYDLHITVKSVEELEKAWEQCNEAIKNGHDYLTEYGNGLRDWFDSLIATVNDTKQVMYGLGNIRLSDLIANFQEVAKKFRDGKISAEDYAKELQKLVSEMNNNKVLQSVIANLDKYIPDEGVRTKVENIIKEVQRLDDAFNMTSPEQIRYWAQVRVDAMKEGLAKTKAQLKAEEKYEISQHGHTREQIELIHKKYDRKRKEAEEKDANERKQRAKQRGKELESVNAELENLRIQNMKDGLDKQIALLNEEKRQKLQRAKDAGIKVGEISVEIEKLYGKKLVDLRKEWALQVEQVYANMWQKIYQLNHDNNEKEYDTERRNIETKFGKLREEADKILGNAPADYSLIGSVEDERKYTEIISKEYDARIENRRQYYAELERLSTEEENKLYENELSRLIENKNNELRTIKNSYRTQDAEMLSNLKKGLITQKQYDEAHERLIEERANNEAYILQSYESKIQELNLEHDKKLKDIAAEGSNAIIHEYEEFMNKAEGILTRKMPEHAWAVPNIFKISKKIKDVKQLYEKLSKDIEVELRNLEKKKGLGEITNEEYEKSVKSLNSLKERITLAVAETEEAQKEALMTFIGTLNNIVQDVGSTINSVIGSLSEITQNQYEAQIAQQEEYISKYEELLKKQEDITKEHADKVNDIEDELKNARGDRRQQLIDQLNAEMAAQRASLAQQKKIEKEKEKAERQKKKLEHDQAVAKKRMDLAQAYINMAMAISMAAVNKWPVPAIPMMALAAAAGAAQIAAIQSQNIPSYGNGGLLQGSGVIQGKSHAQGGVKVLGGRAEVEGGEFITNKLTTSNNVELLEFINTKKKRVNLDDMLEFYVGKHSNVKRVISSVSPRTRFADGGVIPSLRSDFEFNDRLVDTMEAYANRPVWVAVTDIEDAQANVNYVRTLSGMKN